MYIGHDKNDLFGKPFVKFWGKGKEPTSNKQNF